MKFLAVILSSFMLVACGGGDGSLSTPSSPVSPTNLVPVANAGVTQNVVVGAVVSLDGSASSDANGDTLTYAWTLTSKPVGSAASLSSATSVKPTFAVDTAGTYIASLIVNDGKVNSNATAVSIMSSNTAPVLLTADNSNAPSATSQGRVEPMVSNYTNIDGVAGMKIIVNSAGGGWLTIQCPIGGHPKYFYTTSSVTANGAIQYKIGREAAKTEIWTEAPLNGYKLLTPTTFDIGLIKAMYQNSSMKFQWNKYGAGSQIDGLTMEGFPKAIDQTRSACGWDTTIFPTDNGWNQAMPNVPPAAARTAAFVTGSIQEYRAIAWKAKNALGQDALLVRLGDWPGKGPCAVGTGMLGFASARNIYIRQNDVLISTVSGIDNGTVCTAPRFFVLQGNFDVNLPFTMEIYSWHYSVLAPEDPASLSQQHGPFATLTF